MVSSDGRLRICIFFVKGMEFGMWCVSHHGGQDAREQFDHRTDVADDGSEWRSSKTTLSLTFTDGRMEN